jgi:hypothetical protein
MKIMQYMLPEFQGNYLKINPKRTAYYAFIGSRKNLPAGREAEHQGLRHKEVHSNGLDCSRREAKIHFRNTASTHINLQEQIYQKIERKTQNELMVHNGVSDGNSRKARRKAEKEGLPIKNRHEAKMFYKEAAEKDRKALEKIKQEHQEFNKFIEENVNIYRRR